MVAEAQSRLLEPDEPGRASVRRHCDTVGTVDDRPPRSLLSRLTPRELDVLRLVATGQSNDQIGATLFITPKTASVHVSRILAKLGAASRTEASAIAHRERLLADETDLRG